MSNSATPFIRFRQICLASLSLDPVEAHIEAILGVPPCHRSNLEQFGLENTMFAVGGSFIEIVAPTQEHTAAHRFIERTQGIGGYMAIFDCEEVNRLKQNALHQNIGIIYERSDAKADLLQLNPRDTGVTLLEFDRHQNGEERLGAYEWAGENWKSAFNPRVDIIDLSFACHKPQHIAQSWGKLMDKSPDRENNICLDHGRLRFVQQANDRPDYFAGITLAADDPDLYLSRAKKIGLRVEDNCFDLAGVQWSWRKAS
ncbi:VOC family protein [Sneathiella limimaris]|uniref:VOC family protein n=1 Tax=Sneathiella limimaris TaxID=1964213 RepID=UPI00146AD27F|nr:hypothetical protein [Sneathiella limimaris]